MNRIVSLVIFVALCLSAGMIGSMFGPGEWYGGIRKPSWNPPDSVFAPVWTVLYILMGIAAWIVWSSAGGGGRTLPIALFLGQLALNVIWSVLFFGLNRPDLAFTEIIVLWVFICATILAFWKVSPAAGTLLIPYLLWVSFAAALNYQLWRLNA